MDQTANSMYGVLRDFPSTSCQQPVAQPQPVVYSQPAVYRLLSLLILLQSASRTTTCNRTPPGWSMEQWAYYGQQYLDLCKKSPILLSNALVPENPKGAVFRSNVRGLEVINPLPRLKFWKILHLKSMKWKSVTIYAQNQPVPLMKCQSNR